MIYDITWEYGVVDVDVDLDLYKGGTKKATIAIGIGSLDRVFTWEIPSGLDNGKDYTILMTATGTGETSESEEFKIGVEAKEDVFTIDEVVYVIIGSAIFLALYTWYWMNMTMVSVARAGVSICL